MGPWLHPNGRILTPVQGWILGIARQCEGRGLHFLGVLLGGEGEQPFPHCRHQGSPQWRQREKSGVRLADWQAAWVGGEQPFPPLPLPGLSPEVAAGEKWCSENRF